MARIEFDKCNEQTVVVEPCNQVCLSMAQPTFIDDGPTDRDVLFGRGNGSNLHPGNIRFRQLILENVDAYMRAHNREDKDIVALQLIARFEETNGRFLRSTTRPDSTGQGGVVSAWEIVPNKKVVAKVKQALRDAITSFRSKNPGSPSGSAVSGQPDRAKLKPPPNQTVIGKLNRLCLIRPNRRFLGSGIANPEAETRVPQDATLSASLFSTNAEAHAPFAYQASNQGVLRTSSQSKRVEHPSKFMSRPPDNFVVFGRGNFANLHPGNIRYRQLVVEKMEAYRETERREDKDALAIQLIEDIEKNGGGFVQSVVSLDEVGEEQIAWETVPRNRVLSKVKQALRDASSSRTRGTPWGGRTFSRHGSGGLKEDTSEEYNIPETPQQGEPGTMAQSSAATQRWPAQGSTRKHPSESDYRRDFEGHSTRAQPTVSHQNPEAQRSRLFQLTSTQGPVQKPQPANPYVQSLGSLEVHEASSADIAEALLRSSRETGETPLSHNARLDQTTSTSDDGTSSSFVTTGQGSYTSLPPSYHSTHHHSPIQDDDTSEPVYLPHSPSLHRSQIQRHHLARRKTGEEDEQLSTPQGKSGEEHEQLPTRPPPGEEVEPDNDEKTPPKKRKKFGERLEI